MHVWIVNHFALTPDQPGGTRHIELSKELQKHNIEVTIVGAGRHHISDRNHVPRGEPWYRDDVQGVRFHWIKTPSSSSNYLRRIWNNIFFSASVIGRRGLKDLPRPEIIVGTSPDLISHYQPTWLPGFSKSRLSWRYVTFGHSRLSRSVSFLRNIHLFLYFA